MTFWRRKCRAVRAAEDRVIKKGSRFNQEAESRVFSVLGSLGPRLIFTDFDIKLSPGSGRATKYSRNYVLTKGGGRGRVNQTCHAAPAIEMRTFSFVLARSSTSPLFRNRQIRRRSVECESFLFPGGISSSCSQWKYDKVPRPSRSPKAQTGRRSVSHFVRKCCSSFLALLGLCGCVSFLVRSLSVT